MISEYCQYLVILFNYQTQTDLNNTETNESTSMKQSEQIEWTISTASNLIKNLSRLI